MKNYLIIHILFLGGLINAMGQQNTELKKFPLSDVTLLQSPFQLAQHTDRDYMMSLDVDRILAPYLIDAGIATDAKRYTNWENSGLDGHTGGHLLSALAMMYASTGDEEVFERLNYMINQLEMCQSKNGNGYVGGIPGGQEIWKQIREGNIDAGNFSLNGKWVPLYNIHKMYAGLRDAYLFADIPKARTMLIDLTDWMIETTKGLSDEQVQEMLISEHGGLNEVFADVYDITGDKKYMDLAIRFSDQRILTPLLDDQDSLTGLHANTQIPKVIGYNRVGNLTEKNDWVSAAKNFWENVVNERTVSIGGNSVREHFNPVDNFKGMIESNQGPETCNTYNMLRLSGDLFLSEPDARYMDYYERALYNHILSSQHPDGGFVYFTPMRPRHYRVYSQPHMDFWCCVGSGLENHSKYGEIIYSHGTDDLYVNLFIPSKLTWEKMEMVQQTSFPESESSELILTLDQPMVFTLKVRHPGWVAKNDFSIEVNGEPQQIKSTPSSYAEIKREWKDGDRVTIHLPMTTRAEYLPDGSPWVSFVHGPIVLGSVTGTDDLVGLYADDSRMSHVASGPFYPIDESPILLSEQEKNLASRVKPIAGEPLEFSFESGIYPEKYEELRLIPFYKIHEARYVIYWPVVTETELERKLLELKAKEDRLIALENRTVDQIATGEQQPESDHNFMGENTNTGLTMGSFWRDADGWFSYDLRNPDKSGKVLRIRYFGADRNRTFNILLNGKPFKTVTLDDSHGYEFYEIDYEIPDSILNEISSDIMNIRFEATDGSKAGGIYYIRLLKPE